MNRFQVAWIIWVVWFLVWEFYAIKTQAPMGTLSANVWALIGTGTERTGLNWFFRVFLAGLFAWLIPHFYTGWNWFRRRK